MGWERIKTEFVHPPIPVRSKDWVAYLDGREDGPQGWGQNEGEAIANLMEELWIRHELAEVPLDERQVN